VAMFAWAYNLKRVTADFLRALMVPHFTLKPTWAYHKFGFWPFILHERTGRLTDFADPSPRCPV